MNWLDIVIIVLLIGAAISGLITGLIKTVFSLAGLILGVVLAGRFYKVLAEYLGFIPTEYGPSIAAFILIFLVVMIIAALLGVILTKLISAVLLGWLNRIGGAILGVILGIIFITALLVVFATYSGGEVLSGSILASILLDKTTFILALLPDEFNIVRSSF